MGTNGKKAHARWAYLENSPIIRKGFKSITADCVKIIKVLEEEGPLRRSKIIEKTGIPEGNVDRRLYHLRAIEAVHLDKRKYQASRARVKEGTEISEDAKVIHSRSLIPALRQVARIHTSKYITKEGDYVDEPDMKLFIECARDHLRFYPDVWKLIDERTKTEEEAEIEAVRGIDNARNSAFAIGREIEREIRKLILRIESDRPLRGECTICATTDNSL